MSFARLLCVALIGVPCASVAGEELTLDLKARIFEADLERRFVLDGQVAPKLRVPADVQQQVTYNMPDNAYMTGLYLGTLAMKYAATQDPTTRRQATKALEALDLLCNVSGRKGLLARSAIPVDMPFQDDGIWRVTADGKTKWRGDVSSDQIDGVMYGYALAYDLVADQSQKRTIAKNVAALVNHILDNDLRIIGFDDTPTEWGSYYKEYVTQREPMNALIWLQHLKVAHHVTGDARFHSEYRRFALDEGYARLAVVARNTRGRTVNYSDDVLNWLAWYSLLTLEGDPDIRSFYEEGFRKAWADDNGKPGIRDQQNPLYAFTVAKFLDDDSKIGDGVQALKWFPLDMKWNRSTVAAYEREFGFTYDPTPKSPVPESGEFVPIDRRRKQWSVWVHTPYELGDRSADSSMEFNGLDFLMGYWLGRFHGFIPAESN